MNINNYIESGILEEYCLGLLSTNEQLSVQQQSNEHPEIANEIQKIQETIVKYAAQNAVAPPKIWQQDIWNTLENLNKENNLNLNNLPIINRFSDYKKWLNLVIPLIPETVPEDGFHHPLQMSEKVVQILVASGKDVENEIHDDLIESFIILDGYCECTIGDKVIKLGPGGFIEIPLHIDHDVKALSPKVIAIMQRIAV